MEACNFYYSSYSQRDSYVISRIVFANECYALAIFVLVYMNLFVFFRIEDREKLLTRMNGGRG